MLDNLKLEVNGYLSHHVSIVDYYEPFEYLDKTFYPKYNVNGKYIYHSATFDNLHVKIYSDKLRIENSLHKFYHSNNYTDFTFSEVKKAIEKVEDIFHISSSKMKLRKIETAINVEYYKSLHLLFEQYKMNEFENMRKGKTIYGAKCYMTEYNLKAYDKTLETKLNSNTIYNSDINHTAYSIDNLNRYEVEYKKMRVLKGMVNTLSDLKNRRVFQKLGNKMLGYFDNIITSNPYDYSVLNSQERSLVFAGLNSEFWKVEEINPNTRKKKKRRFNQCIQKLEKANDINHKEEIRNLLLEKLNYLTSN